DLRAAGLLEGRDIADMIAMAMRRGDDLDVTDPKTELLDVVFDQRIRTFDARVDQNQTLPGVDQVAAQIIGADIVEIADDLEARERLLPILIEGRRFFVLQLRPLSHGGGGNKAERDPEKQFRLHAVVLPVAVTIEHFGAALNPVKTVSAPCGGR